MLLQCFDAYAAECVCIEAAIATAIWWQTAKLFHWICILASPPLLSTQLLTCTISRAFCQTYCWTSELDRVCV